MDACWQRLRVRIGGAALVATALAGCSVKTYVVDRAGKALAGGGTTWSSDDDPELVRDASPFALKTIESAAGRSPRSTPGCCWRPASGFTQYAYAFVQSEADYVEASDLARAHGAARAGGAALPPRARLRPARARGGAAPARGAAPLRPGAAPWSAVGEKATGAAAVLDRGGVGRGDLARQGQGRADRRPARRWGADAARRSRSTTASARARSTTSSSPTTAAGRPRPAARRERARRRLRRGAGLSHGTPRRAVRERWRRRWRWRTQDRAEFAKLLEPGAGGRRRRGARAAAGQPDRPEAGALAARARRRAVHRVSSPRG